MLVMMMVHGCYVLINQCILSLKGSFKLMLMSLRGQRGAVICVSNRAVLLSLHYYLVILLAEKWRWRGHADLHQGLLQCYTRALKLRQVAVF